MKLRSPSTLIYMFAYALLVSACVSTEDANNTQQAMLENTSEDLTKTVKMSRAERDRRALLTKDKSSRPALNELDLSPIDTTPVAVPQMSLAQKKAEYEALLPMISDPVQRQQVAFRLADIKMMLAEQAQQNGSDLQLSVAKYDEAVNDFRRVLAQNEVLVPLANVELTSEQQAANRKQMDAMYQLSRALDLSAKADESIQVAKQFLTTFSLKHFATTPYHIELYFRVGEYYFNRQQYQNAIEHYQQVVDFGHTSQTQSANFYAISAYMLGWSHFKLDNYDAAMLAFAQMLDASLIHNVANTNDRARHQKISKQQLLSTPLNEFSLSKGDLRLIKDSIRVMALTFSYKGNANAITRFFKDFGQRDYAHLIYDELAQQHLDNDRYQDSANALVAFASANPAHPRAVEFYIRHIDAFILGDFPEKVLMAKQSFVSTYSLGAGVLLNLKNPLGREVSPYLRKYIKQLAQTEHSIAQTIEAILNQREQSQETSQVTTNANTLSTQQAGFVANQTDLSQQSTFLLATNEDLNDLRQQAYSKAKNHYQNFIATFTNDPQVPLMRFYMAEALVGLAQYAEAIDAFETYAYIDSRSISAQLASLSDNAKKLPSAADAAYAALLVYQTIQKQQTTVAPEPQNQLKGLVFEYPLSTQQLSQTRFCETFANDKRAVPVAVNVMLDLFEQENYIPAQKWADFLLNRDNVAATSQQSAMLVMAHSYFAMENFASAEKAYRLLFAAISQLSSKPISASEGKGLITGITPELSDKLAASLYKQAEFLLNDAKLDTKSLKAQNINRKSQLRAVQISTIEQGLGLLQKVVTDTPSSTFRQAAQFDSAIYYTLLENWPKAISTFTDFQTRYPLSPLSQGVDEQLLYAYEQAQNWPKVANLLLEKHTKNPNSDTGRLALFQAAEYFEKAGDRPKALANFRTYAHSYPQPFEKANEARFTLSEFYLQSGEDSKRRFWLNKLISAQTDIMQTSPNLSTPRSVYLASMAAMTFAQDADTAFARIKLTQPLMQSLQKKQLALNKAIKQYEQVISFGSAQYVTAANYKLANLYMVLAQDLMDSTRPDGMSPLELSQYEILLEEQAYPFEETAIDLHVKNIDRVRLGLYDTWVKESFAALRKTMPARYNKPELIVEVNADDL